MFAEFFFKALFQGYFEFVRPHIIGLEDEIACGNQRARLAIAELFGKGAQILHDDAAIGRQDNAVQKGDEGAHGAHPFLRPRVK